MAPVTRLQAKHTARASRGSEQTRSLRTRKVVIDLTQSPDRPSTADPVTTVKSIKSEQKQAKVASKYDGMKAECCICADEKGIIRNFKLVDDERTCEHFCNICVSCVEQMLTVKIKERKLQEADLACPFGDCDHVLDMDKLRATVTKKHFTRYSDALTKQLLQLDPNFIACLNPLCGQYFSIEGCKPADGKGKGKQTKSTKLKIACPQEHCGYELCVACTRPWHSKRGCDQGKRREDEASEAQIKQMGAKACPKCGVNILKTYGCDHMTCHNCRHGFCWQCLVPYQPGVDHVEGCSNRERIGLDPRDWLPNVPVDQIQAMLNQAQVQLPALAQGPPGFQAQMQMLVNNALNAGNNEVPGPPHGQPVVPVHHLQLIAPPAQLFQPLQIAAPQDNPQPRAPPPLPRDPLFADMPGNHLAPGLPPDLHDLARLHVHQLVQAHARVQAVAAPVQQDAAVQAVPPGRGFLRTIFGPPRRD